MRITLERSKKHKQVMKRLDEIDEKIEDLCRPKPRKRPVKKKATTVPAKKVR